MQAVQKKINGYLNAGIMTAAVFIVLGVLFLVFPEGFLNILRWIIAVVSIVSGASMIAAELTRKKGAPFFGATALGAILVVIGLIFATHEGATGIFAIVLGAWFIVSSLATLRFSSALTGSSAFLSTLMAIISFVCGLLLIINPWGGSVSMMIVIGILMIVYAASTLVDLCVMKGHLKDLSKKFKNLVIDVEVETKDDAKVK